MMAEDAWMNFFRTYDTAATVRQVRTRVLILTGSRGMQSAPEQVAPIQAAAFKEAGNTDVTACVLPDLDHLFVHDTDGLPQNYAKLWSPVMIDSNAVEPIVDWLESRLKPRTILNRVESMPLVHSAQSAPVLRRLNATTAAAEHARQAQENCGG
jgi:hypothetical protein